MRVELTGFRDTVRGANFLAFGRSNIQSGSESVNLGEIRGTGLPGPETQPRGMAAGPDIGPVQEKPTRSWCRQAAQLTGAIRSE